MKHRTTRRLYDYWLGRRAGRAAPGRADIEPSDIHTLLADTFILQCDADGTAPFRLSGTRLCVLFDRELKGCDFRSLWEGADVETVAAALRLLREDMSPVVVRWRGLTEDERGVDGELVLLPLTMGGTEIARVLGALVPFELPYWLGTVPLTRLRIASVRMVDAAPGREPVIGRSLAALPRAAVPATATEGRRIAHLTVLDGGQADR